MGRNEYLNCGHLKVCQSCEFYREYEDTCFFFGEHIELPDENGVRPVDFGCCFNWDHEERNR